MRIKILHTNDIHSNLENFSKIATLIEELKDENTFIFDSGDFTDFKRLEIKGTKGRAAAELFQAVGYDALAIGNNETFDGKETMINMVEKSGVPYVSSNLKNLDGSDIKFLRKSTIIEKNGIKVLIVGTSACLEQFAELDGLKCHDTIKVIGEEIEKNKGNYDICVLLSHEGTKKDRETAKGCKGIDIIISAHDHVLMEKPEIINQAIMNSAGVLGSHLGVLEVEIEKGEKRILRGETIDVSEVKRSETIDRIIEQNRIRALDALEKPLYEINRDLWHDVIEENPITNFLADGIMKSVECDFVIINSGVIEGGIRKGDVNEKILLDICSSPLNPTSFEIKGKHIYESAQQSLDSRICKSDGKGPGFRGKYLGRIHVSSNVIIEHDGRNIISVKIEGKELEMEKWYKIGSSDYLERGSGYPQMGINKNVQYNSEFLRDTLKEYLNEENLIEGSFKNRWKKI